MDDRLQNKVILAVLVCRNCFPAFFVQKIGFLMLPDSVWLEAAKVSNLMR